MGLAVIHSRARMGIDAPPVQVEVHMNGGLPALTVVGLPETVVRESRDRVRSALMEAGFELPSQRITINLAPADLPKDGSRYDLAMAIGILAASGQLRSPHLGQLEFLGELSLDGSLRSVPGALPAARACSNAGRRLVLPDSCATEAALVADARIWAAQHLAALVAQLRRRDLPECWRPVAGASHPANPPSTQGARRLPLHDVRGQDSAKRALVIAAAGGHNILFRGPPGTGKSMLARRLPGLLPPMTEQECLDVVAIHSVAGCSTGPLLARQRPFREPHHSASAAALVGGGRIPRPGEISLAHNGVLFMDELPEYNRQVLEVLREPLESGEIVIARARATVRYPARFQLVAAMNPCPAGRDCQTEDHCLCTPSQARRYQQRLSGPLLDRIDLHVEVPPVPQQLLQHSLTGAERKDAEQDEQALLAKLWAAREQQLRRAGCANSALSIQGVERWCQPDAAGRQLLARAAASLALSARAWHRLLRVARSIADLDGLDGVGVNQVAEALACRQLPTD